MRYYVETSAAAKLLVEEADTPALRAFLNEVAVSDDLMSSALLETELRRVAVREDLDQQDVSAVLGRFDLVDIRRSAFRAAGVLPGSALRSLDALHLAVASRINADVVVSYDARLIEAARSLGFDVASPVR